MGETNVFTHSRINRVYILKIGNVFINAPHLWNELRNMMLISTLFILYLVLLGPYLVRGKVDQIRQVIFQFQLWNILYLLYIYVCKQRKYFCVDFRVIITLTIMTYEMPTSFLTRLLAWHRQMYLLYKI